MTESNKVVGNTDLENFEVAEVNAVEFGKSSEVTVGEPFDPNKFQAKTAKNLAYWFVLILAASIAVHYAAIVLVAIFAKEQSKDLTDRLQVIFNAWLPVIASLVSSVAAFYFAKAGSDKPKNDGAN